MTTHFEQLLEDRIPEANFLTIADTRYEPGAILFSQDTDVWTDQIQSFLIPPFQDEDFETELVPGDFTLAEASGSFSGNAALSLLGFLGLRIASQKQFEVKISVEELKVKRYVSRKMGLLAFEKALRKLKEEDSNTFKLLRRRFLVFTSLYASRFRLEFESGSALGGEVEFDDGSISADAGVNLQRQDNGVLVSNNIAVPFAVTGFEISKRGRILEPA